MKLLNKKLLLVLGIVLLSGLVVPHLAHAAGMMEQALTDVVTYTFKFITYIFAYIGSVLFSFAGMLVDYTLRLNMTVGDTEKNLLLGVGWGITKDIANLGFVLAMIIIAFATIIGNESYGYKKLLANLIGAAIAVNFSLAIAGVFIDFSHVITVFFINKISTTGASGMAEQMANAFSVQNFLLEDSNNPLPPNPSEESGTMSRLSTAVVISLVSLVFVLVFTITAAIIFLIFAIMLLARYVWLSFLLIIAPITWLFWVIPGMSGKFGEWWSNFLKQVFFAPAMTFFLYLAFMSVQGLAEKPATGAFFKDGALAAIISSGANMVVLIGILVGGLITAEKMGATGAKMGMERLSALGGASKDYAGSIAKKYGKKVAETKAVKGVQSAALRVGSSARKLAEYKPTSRTGKILTAVTGLGLAKSVVGLGGEKLQNIGGVPVNPDSLSSRAWSAVWGKYPDNRAQSKKDADEREQNKGAEELTADHEKLRTERQRLVDNGVSEKDPRIVTMDKQLGKLKASVVEKTSLPKDVEGLINKEKELKLKLEELAAGGSDISVIKKQLEKATDELDKAQREDSKITPASRAWKSHRITKEATRMAGIVGRTIKPGEPDPDTDTDSAIAQEKLWREIDTQKKPNSKPAWAERVIKLDAALTEATAARLPPLPPDAIKYIKDLRDEAVEKST
ncbi:MAG: hypothetical protein WCO21_01855 [bacterium]